MIKVLELKHKRGYLYDVTYRTSKEDLITQLTEDIIVKHRVNPNTEFDETTWNNIIQTNAKDMIYQKILTFIEYQMRTIAEVKKKLTTLTDDSTLMNELIQTLKQQGYLSDTLYAKEFVKEKIEFDLVGPKYIKEKLISKGIHFDIIDSYLLEYNQQLELEKCIQLIEKECRYPIKKPLKKAVQSIQRRLVNKGFHLSVVSLGINQMKDRIEEMVDEEALLQSVIHDLRKKYDITTYQGKQKLIQSCLQKGYSYQTIQKLLS